MTNDNVIICMRGNEKNANNFGQQPIFQCSNNVGVICRVCHETSVSDTILAVFDRFSGKMKKMRY